MEFNSQDTDFQGQLLAPTCNSETVSLLLATFRQWMPFRVIYAIKQFSFYHLSGFSCQQEFLPISTTVAEKLLFKSLVHPVQESAQHLLVHTAPCIGLESDLEQ